MANIQSAKKRNRQNPLRYGRNHAYLSRLRTFVKRAEAAIKHGDHNKAKEAVSAAEPVIAKGVTKGVMHQNTAARKISRLNARVRVLA